MLHKKLKMWSSHSRQTKNPHIDKIQLFKQTPVNSRKVYKNICFSCHSHHIVISNCTVIKYIDISIVSFIKMIPFL